MADESSLAARLTAIRNKLRERNFELHPASEERVLQYEQLFGIRLPEDYRAFITQITNGGPCGLLPLEGGLSYERGPGYLPGVIPPDFLSRPFPHADSYNPDEDPRCAEFDDALERGSMTEEDLDAWWLDQTAGAITICDDGCGRVYLLVISGESRGEVWLDAAVNRTGYIRLRLGFLEWYAALVGA